MTTRMMHVAAALALLWLAACTPLPPSPQDIQAKRFETVPEKAVVYLFRDAPDFSDEVATVLLNDSVHGSTYPGTYMRLELAPGRHRISGFATDSGIIEFNTQPGRLYFLQQSVASSLFRWHTSFFRFVDEAHGRTAVLRSELVGAGI